MTELERLAQLVVDRSPALALYARQWLDAASAEDAVQEALTALLGQRPPPTDPVAWMYRSVRNRAIDAVRAASRRRFRERAIAGQRLEWFEESAEAMLDGQTAETALRQLPEDLREVVVLRIWGDLGFAQIAQVLGVGVSTVHGRYASALAQMRHLLENPCGNRTT